jgi:four helix bundle protein
VLSVKAKELEWMAYRSFEELEVWKRGCRLAVRVYEALRECRDFGLKDQMTRAAVSIPSNIAEGAERETAAEFVRFLHIAKGSAAELRTQVYIAAKLGVLDKDVQKELVDELTQLSAMLHALIKSQKPPAA